MRTKPADEAYYMGEYPDTVTPVLYKKNVRHLYSFITERYNIYKLRERGCPAPWTDNPILREFKFTNVRREHDRTTLWFINKIANNPALSYQERLLRAVAYRLYSKVETCEMLRLDDPDTNVYSQKVLKALIKDAPEGYVFYTNAFYTTGMKMGIQATYQNADRNLLPCRLIKTMKNSLPECWDNPQEAINWLSHYNGIGYFLAYQIFVDWTYVNDFPYSENEFVVAGPGAKRGLSCIFKDAQGLSHAQQLFWLRDNLEGLFQKIEPDFSVKALFDNLPKYDRRFNVMSLQNCMCELSKYIRAVEGTGRPKNKYQAGGNKHAVNKK